MKKILLYSVIALVAFLIFGIIYLSSRSGKTDATLGMERTCNEWSADQEAVFDSIRQDTSESILLFDRLKITKKDLDQQVRRYANIQLSIMGRECLLPNCTMVYEFLQFDEGGVKVMDTQGKWHRSMTYGTEPVVHIFKEGYTPDLSTNLPFHSFFLRCINGYVELQDPIRKAKVAVRPVLVKELKITVIGVIDEYHYPCHIIPDLLGWLLFAEDNNIPVMYKDVTWKRCSFDMVWEKFSHGYLVAIDLPAGTEVISAISADGKERISIRNFHQLYDDLPWGM